MDKRQYERTYWNQYQLLEKEFLETTLYVDLDITNYSTYSNAYLKLLLTLGSEVDNALRELSGLTGRSSISSYAQFVLNKYPNIVNQVVETTIGNIRLTPFSGWSISQPSQTLGFWNAYNEIKHDRVTNLHNASLENVLNALAGLYIIETYRLKELYDSDPNTDSSYPKEDSELLVLDSWSHHVRPSKLNAAYPLYDDDDGSRIL